MNAFWYEIIYSKREMYSNQGHRLFLQILSTANTTCREYRCINLQALAAGFTTSQVKQKSLQLGFENFQWVMTLKNCHNSVRTQVILKTSLSSKNLHTDNQSGTINSIHARKNIKIPEHNQTVPNQNNWRKRRKTGQSCYLLTPKVRQIKYALNNMLGHQSRQFLRIMRS